MPNTFAHLGVQTVITRSCIRSADIKWIGIGCVIPDIPWILQRIIGQFIPAIDALDLRIYCMIQASFSMCLIFALALAVLTSKPGKIFFIISVNCLFHLLLDAMQTKWANGVHFLAPFDWRLVQLQLFWPEANITLVLTGIGVIALFVYGWLDRNRQITFSVNYFRSFMAALLMLIYLLVPFMFFAGPIKADNHYVQTLRNIEERQGKEIGFDRCRFEKNSSTIRVFTKEEFTVTGALPKKSGSISLIGEFSDQQSIAIKQLYEHTGARDFYSYLGLLSVLALWITSFVRKRVSINWRQQHP